MVPAWDLENDRCHNAVRIELWPKGLDDTASKDCSDGACPMGELGAEVLVAWAEILLKEVGVVQVPVTDGFGKNFEAKDAGERCPVSRNAQKGG
jgi:hypothetical protein